MPSQRQRTRVYFPNVLGIAQHLVQEELETPVCSESLAKPQPTQPVLWGARAWNVIGRHELGLSVTFKKQKDFSSLLNWLVWLGFLTGRMKTRVLRPPTTCMFLFGGIPHSAEATGRLAFKRACALEVPKAQDWRVEVQPIAHMCCPGGESWHPKVCLFSSHASIPPSFLSPFLCWGWNQGLVYSGPLSSSSNRYPFPTSSSHSG